MEIRGPRVVLRDGRPEDAEARLRWVTVELAWADWDAPWEAWEPVTPERVAKARASYEADVAEPPEAPRGRLFVELADGPLLGWVNQYHHDRANRTTLVGIDLCESAYWGQGLGTEALGLWTEYLLREADLHRVGAETWSGNERMMRLADRLGFTLEGRLRETVEVRGRRYDSLKYGLLHHEWRAPGR